MGVGGGRHRGWAAAHWRLAFVLVVDMQSVLFHLQVAVTTRLSPCLPHPSCSHLVPTSRLQYDKLQSELAAAASQASRLAQENSALRSASPAAGPVADPALGPDPLAAQQVSTGWQGAWLADLLFELACRACTSSCFAVQGAFVATARPAKRPCPALPFPPTRWRARWRRCCRRSRAWWRRTTGCCGRIQGCRCVRGGGLRVGAPSWWELAGHRGTALGGRCTLVACHNR